MHILRAARRSQSGGYRFAAEDSRLYNLSRYDEVTAQAPELADDRDRDPGDTVHLLFRATAGLRRDAIG